VSDDSIIKDPFKTIIDFNEKSPLTGPDAFPEEVIKQSSRKALQKAKDQPEEAEKLTQSIEELSKNPDIEELFMDEVHRTVSKQDDHVVKTTLYVVLSAFFKPLNLALKAESGSGKSYGIMETVKFFPKEIIEAIGTQSPKVISHQNGIRKTKDGEEIGEAPEKPSKFAFNNGSQYSQFSDYGDVLKYYKEQKKEYDEKIKNSFYEVDLRNKILLFLESFNLETFKMFKITMSRDAEYIDHKFVDDKGHVHITRLLGSPVIITCSVDENGYIEEWATRTFGLTPTTTSAKFIAANQISNKKSAYPWLYSKATFNQTVIQEYIRKLHQTMQNGKIQVAIPFDGIAEAFPSDVTRDMRDFNRFLELLPSFAIFRLFQRPIVVIGGTRYLLPTIQDALDAKELFDCISETTKTNTDARTLEFYFNYIADKLGGIDSETLTDLYNRDHKKKAATRTIRKWLERLEEISWVDVREGTHETAKGYVDKRFNNYIPLKPKNMANTVFQQNIVDLKPIFEKAFNSWLQNAVIESDPPPIILNIDGTAKRISLEEIKDIIINNKKGGSNIVSAFFNPEESPKEEIKPKSMDISKKSIDATFSRTIIAKPIKRKGGVYCMAMSHGTDCPWEAEWDINGNLYCKDHFPEQAKLCEDNGVRVEIQSGAS
jgi:hypothetical protein